MSERESRAAGSVPDPRSTAEARRTSAEPDAAPTRSTFRYGDRGSAARRRRGLVVAGSALGLVGVGYAAWVALASADEPSFTPRSYEHLSDTLLLVTFSVTKPPEATAVCQVEALSSGSARVGLTSIEVPPTRMATTTVRAELRTQERAVYGGPLSCALR